MHCKREADDLFGGHRLIGYFRTLQHDGLEFCCLDVASRFDDLSPFDLCVDLGGDLPRGRPEKLEAQDQCHPSSLESGMRPDGRTRDLGGFLASGAADHSLCQVLWGRGRHWGGELVHPMELSKNVPGTVQL